MPFFSRKFGYSKTSERKKLDFHVECLKKDLKRGSIHLKLGEDEFVFDLGKWSPVIQEGLYLKKDFESLRKISNELREENNLLKIKLEILLDMLTLETTKAHEMRNGVAKHCENDHRAL